MRELRLAEMKERTAQWEGMNSPEVPRVFPSKVPEPVRPASKAKPDRTYDPDRPETNWRRIALAILMMLMVSGGVYACFTLTGQEPKLDALTVWKEYAADSTTAAQSYKGRFVKVTGKVKLYRARGEVRTFFAAPDGTTWGIQFLLPAAEVKQLEDGAKVTIRGRFATREGRDLKGNLPMSNASLVAVHPDS